jgi:threonine dehydratase
MPKNADELKRHRVQLLGADVCSEAATLGEAIDIARAIARDNGKIFIEDGDDVNLMLGAGTIALEVFDQLPRTALMLVPVGGGNLIAGIAACAKQINPCVRVIGIQSESAPAVFESWRNREKITRVANTFAGGLAADFPGELALGVINEHVDDLVLVSDGDLHAAIARGLIEIGEVLEGAGAAPLAALERYGVGWKGQVVVAILSGGNASHEELLNAMRTVLS